MIGKLPSSREVTRVGETGLTGLMGLISRIRPFKIQPSYDHKSLGSFPLGGLLLSLEQLLDC